MLITISLIAADLSQVIGPKRLMRTMSALSIAVELQVRETGIVISEVLLQGHSVWEMESVGQTMFASGDCLLSSSSCRVLLLLNV